MSVVQKIQKLILFAGPALFDQALVSGTNFAMAVILAWILGMSAFGQFSLVLVIVFFGLQIQQSLIAGPMMTLAAHFERVSYFKRLFLLQFAVTLLLSLAVWAFIEISVVYFPKWEIGGLGLVTALMLFFRSSQEFIRRQLFIEGRPWTAIIMSTIACAFIVVGTAIFYFKDALDVPAAVLLHAFAYGSSLVFFHAAQRGRAVVTAGLGEVARAHWQLGGWLLAGSVAAYAASNLLLLAGSAVLGSEAAGLIKAAQYTMGGMIVLFQAVENFMPHHLAVVFERGDRKNFRVSAVRSTVLMALFCAVHGAVLYLFLDWITNLLAPGQEPIFRTIVIVNIVISFVLVFIYNAQYLMRAKGITRPIFVANLIASIFSLIAGKYLAVTFGFDGVIGGILMVNIFVLLYYIYWGWRYDAA